MLINKKILNILGISLLFATTIVFCYTSILAYMNPSKQVILDINSIGEANIEFFIVMPLVLIFGLFSLIQSFKNISKNN